MTDLTQDVKPNYLELTADIVAAYVSNNSVPVSAVADLLSEVHAVFRGLTASRSDASAQDKVHKLTPAQIRKSITPNALISFEDGKAYKTLKRHLRLRGLSPEAYRAKYGLRADYPMISANYSAQRSELALALGLGQARKRVATPAAPTPEETVSERAAPPPEKPKKAGRPRKTAAA